MGTITKIVLTIVTWAVVTLVVAASLEVLAGRSLPALVQLATLIVLAPALFLIWRPTFTTKQRRLSVIVWLAAALLAAPVLVRGITAARSNDRGRADRAVPESPMTAHERRAFDIRIRSGLSPAVIERHFSDIDRFVCADGSVDIDGLRRVSPDVAAGLLHNTSTDSQPCTPVSVDELIAAYEANVFAAEQRYGRGDCRTGGFYDDTCKRVEVQGVVQSLGRDNGGAAYVILENPEATRRLAADFTSDAEVDLVPLQRGELVGVWCLGERDGAKPLRLASCVRARRLMAEGQ